MHHHHLNPYAPLYYPSHFPPPPPPPPPLPPSSHIRTTYICYFPVPPPLHPHAFPFVPLLPPTGTHHQPHHNNNKAKIKETEKQLVWLPKLKHDHDDGIKISTSTNCKFLSATPVVAPVPIPSVPLQLDFCSAAPEFLMKGTTVMIKNIPNKLTRELLIEMLDEYCAEQQKKKYVNVAVAEYEYDFVYLPIDFSTGANKGYAFVNFTTAEAARTAYEQMHHRKWLLFNSKKVARLSFARVQGRIALVNRFKCTQFNCDSDEYLPATFKPPRNGTTSLPPPDNVGKRIMRFHFQ